MQQLTAVRAREVLSYAPATGRLAWLVRTGPRGVVGAVAGSLHVHGYQLVCVDGHKYFAHRIAWLITYGVWPDGQIDHINGNRADNRLENLRDVPRAINAQNQRRAPKHNASGLLGVSRHNKRWRARITVNKRTIRLGTFDTPCEAFAVYVNAKRRLHGGCTI